MKKIVNHRLNNVLSRSSGMNELEHAAKASLTIALGLVVAALIFLVAIQTGDFNMVKEKMMLLKSIARWAS